MGAASHRITPLTGTYISTLWPLLQESQYYLLLLQHQAHPVSFGYFTHAAIRSHQMLFQKGPNRSVRENAYSSVCATWKLHTPHNEITSISTLSALIHTIRIVEKTDFAVRL